MQWIAADRRDTDTAMLTVQRGKASQLYCKDDSAVLPIVCLVPCRCNWRRKLLRGKLRSSKHSAQLSSSKAARGREKPDQKEVARKHISRQQSSLMLAA